MRSLATSILLALMLALPQRAIAKTAAELNALATLRYQSAQTEVVSARLADAKLIAMRGQVETGNAALARARAQLAELRTAAGRNQAAISRLESETDRLLAELAKVKTEFTETLAQRDADYARDIAILQTAGEQLLSTPEGVEALALYNAGGPGAFEAADKVLGAVELARASVREQAARFQQSEDRRARARLAIDARDKGLTTTAVAVERWEAVVALKATTARDWVTLVDLYLEAGLLAKASAAADQAFADAKTADDRSIALGRRSDVFLARENLPAALKDAEGHVAIARETSSLAGATEWQIRNLPVSLKQIAYLKVRTEQFDEALAFVQEALKLDRARLASKEERETRRDVGIDLSMIADIRTRKGELAVAEALYREPLAISRALHAEDPREVLSRKNVSWDLSSLAYILERQGNLSGARASHEEALAIDRALLAEDPDRAEFLAAVSADLASIASILSDQGEESAALSARKEALELARRQVAIDPSMVSAQSILADRLEDLANSMWESEPRATVLRKFEEALAIRRRLFSASPSSPAMRSDLVSTIASIGILYEFNSEISQYTADAETARTHYVEALALLKSSTAPVDPSELAGVLENLADVEVKLGNVKAALTAVEKAVSSRRAKAEIDTTDARAQDRLAGSLGRLALMRSMLKRSDALGPAQEALTIRKALATRDPTSIEAQESVLKSMARLAHVHRKGGDEASALAVDVERLALLRNLQRRAPDSLSVLRSLLLELHLAATKSGTDVADRNELYNEIFLLSRKELALAPGSVPVLRAYLSNIGKLLALGASGDQAKITSLGEEALAGARSLAAADSETDFSRGRVADTLRAVITAAQKANDAQLEQRAREAAAEFKVAL